MVKKKKYGNSVERTGNVCWERAKWSSKKGFSFQQSLRFLLSRGLIIDAGIYYIYTYTRDLNKSSCISRGSRLKHDCHYSQIYVW